MKGQCSRFSIKGKQVYSLLVDEDFLIIECNPLSEYLLFKDFRAIFEEWKDKVYITHEGNEPYPLVVEEDIIDIYSKKNPVFNNLIEKFNLTV